MRLFYNRSFCLECSPFGKLTGQKLLRKVDRITPRICKRCGKIYIYDRKKGHRSEYCNSCKVICHDIKKKGRAIEYKGGKCIVCGYNRCHRGLCFHHLDPNTKSFSIGQGHSRSWESMKKELDKCVLLCQLCHCEVHENLIKIEDYL